MDLATTNAQETSTVQLQQEEMVPLGSRSSEFKK